MRDEGPQALYKGFTPVMLRAFPANAVSVQNCYCLSAVGISVVKCFQTVFLFSRSYSQAFSLGYISVSIPKPGPLEHFTKLHKSSQGSYCKLCFFLQACFLAFETALKFFNWIAPNW